MEVDFVGHPLMDIVDQHPDDPDFLSQQHLSEAPIIALLPGSRKQEIKRMLAKMLEVADDFKDYQFVIAGAPAIDTDFYQNILTELRQKWPNLNCNLVQNQTYSLLKKAKAALVTSGTATLETALFGVPQVVCYTGNQLSYWIARQLINVKYISLVNLIVDRPLLKELIQKELNTSNLKHELNKILEAEGCAQIQAGYSELRQILGKPGASAKVAQLVFEAMQVT